MKLEKFRRKLREKFNEIGVVIENDHFTYTSGRHGTSYFNKDKIYENTKLVSLIAKHIANYYKSMKPEIIVAPAIGGAILGQWVSRHLNYIPSIYAEKDATNPNGFSFFRGYDELLHKDIRVLAVEDVVNTGGSLRGVIQEVQKYTKNVMAACICNRGDVRQEELGALIDFMSLTYINASSYEYTSCPLCLSMQPMNKKFGKGRLL